MNPAWWCLILITCLFRSVNGQRSFPGVLAYCVSKAALDQFTRCVALELAPKGVRVNAVSPGVIITELQKRAGLSEEAYANVSAKCVRLLKTWYLWTVFVNVSVPREEQTDSCHGTSRWGWGGCRCHCFSGVRWGFLLNRRHSSHRWGQTCHVPKMKNCQSKLPTIEQGTAVSRIIYTN